MLTPLSEKIFFNNDVGCFLTHRIPHRSTEKVDPLNENVFSIVALNKKTQNVEKALVVVVFFAEENFKKT